MLGIKYEGFANGKSWKLFKITYVQIRSEAIIENTKNRLAAIDSLQHSLDSIKNTEQENQNLVETIVRQLELNNIKRTKILYNSSRMSSNSK